MTPKASKVFVTLAFVFGLLTLVLSLLVYLGPVDWWIQLFSGSPDLTGIGTAINIPALVVDGLLFLYYFLAFLVTVISKYRKAGFVVGLIMLILILILKLASPAIGLLSTSLVAQKGVEYMALYSIMNQAHSLLCGAFSLLALVFFCISFGALCVKRPVEQ